MIASIPVDPDAETARRWAEDELSKSAYQDQGESWLARVMEWIGGLFDDVGNLGSSWGVPGGLFIGLGVAAVLALAIWLIAGPLGRARRAKSADGVFDDDHRGVEALEESANAAARGGDWDTAVVEMYRAVVRHLEERGIIDVPPGLTAWEAATDAALALPDLRDDLVIDATAFDGVRYGHSGANKADYDHILATFTAVRRARARVTS